MVGCEGGCSQQQVNKRALHRERAFFCLAFFVRATAAAFEAFVASVRRCAAVIEFARANPPSRAISRTSIGARYHRAC